MASYALTDEAQRDLTEIRQFTLEKWGRTQSRDYLSRLRHTLQNLADMPMMGKNREDELGPGTYSFPYVSHMVYYEPSSQGIIVLAILHQSQVPAHYLL